jgi:2,5-furandicarboxylate decarboxylase 1
MSCRERPLFQALQPWTSEDDTLFNLCIGSGLLEDLRRRFEFVKDLHLMPGTVGAHAVISVGDSRPPVVRSALTSLFALNPFIKMVIAVNDDVDPRNYREVEWAVATRFQADRDLIVLPGLQGSPIDPSAGPDASVCKVGIDATFPMQRMGSYQKIGVPEESRRIALQILERVSGGFHPSPRAGRLA